MKRQAKPPADVRDEAYRLALEHARDREADGDPEGAGVIRDLAAAIKRIRLTRDVAAKPLTIADLELNVRLANTLGLASPASLVCDVLDDDTHPLRSTLRKGDLKELVETRSAIGA